MLFTGVLSQRSNWSFSVCTLAIGLTATFAVAYGQDTQIELHYSADDQIELIEEGIFESSQFQNQTILVTEASIIDIAALTSGVNTPVVSCYRGTAPAAKKLIEKMIDQTDGNGEHYLEHSSVQVFSSGKIKSKFTVVGPGGRRVHSVEFTVCSSK